MVTFNFSNLTGTGSTLVTRGTTTATMTLSAVTTPSGVSSTVVFPGDPFIISTGTPPIVLTSNVPGEDLPGDSMKFTLTPQTLFFVTGFSDNDDSLFVGKFGGFASYVLTFDAGNGLTKMSNVVLGGSSQRSTTPPTGGTSTVTSSIQFLTESGTQSTSFTGEITGIKFTITGNLFGGYQLNSITGTPTCFARGTRIAVPGGEEEVQDLRIGDSVLTADGDTRKVLWVGRQSYDTRSGVPDHLRPVRIAAGALGHDLPQRDLVVTADHALMLDGYMINASALVNGTSITFDGPEDVGRRHTVFHIETEDHAVILAEGCPAETFVDAVQRSAFDNYQQYVDLYGADRLIRECDLPRISSQRMLPEMLREKLGLTRAA